MDEDKFSLADLAPSDYNPRSIDGPSAEGLRNSMELFGDISGLTFNVRTKRLIAGHARRRVIEQLKSDAVVRMQSKTTDKKGTIGYGCIEALGTTWPVRFVDWDETTEKAANLAANNPSITGDFTAGVEDILCELGTTSFIDMLRLEEIEWPEYKPPPGDVPPDPFSKTGGDDGPNPTPLDDFVAFQFGEIKGRVSKDLYDDFRVVYNRLRVEKGTPLMDDTLRDMLHLEEHRAAEEAEETTDETA